jgi:hypothetical protein
VVDVAKLVNAPDCGSGIRGFESHHSPQKHTLKLYRQIKLFIYGMMGLEQAEKDNPTYGRIIPPRPESRDAAAGVPSFTPKTYIKALSTDKAIYMYAQHGRYLYGESPERGLASAYRSREQGCPS